MLADHERRRNFRVAVFGDVKVEEKLDQRPFQSCAPVRVEQKSAAGKFCAAREIHQLERFAQFHVRLRFEGEVRLSAVNPDLRIVLRGCSNHDRFVRQVWQLQHQHIASGFAFRRLLVKCGNFFTQVFRLGLFRLSLGDFLLPHQRSDFLAHAIALGLESFHFREKFPPLLVQFEQFVHF